jgi:hypothetical protein
MVGPHLARSRALGCGRISKTNTSQHPLAQFVAVADHKRAAKLGLR